MDPKERLTIPEIREMIYDIKIQVTDDIVCDNLFPAYSVNSHILGFIL